MKFTKNPKIAQDGNTFFPIDHPMVQDWVSAGNTLGPAQNPEEIAADQACQAQATQDAADLADAKADAKVQAFASQTKAQWKSSVDSCSTLDDLKALVKTLGIVVRVLVKRL